MKAGRRPSWVRSASHPKNGFCPSPGLLPRGPCCWRPKGRVVLEVARGHVFLHPTLRFLNPNGDTRTQKDIVRRTHCTRCNPLIAFAWTHVVRVAGQACPPRPQSPVWRCGQGHRKPRRAPLTGRAAGPQGRTPARPRTMATQAKRRRVSRGPWRGAHLSPPRLALLYPQSVPHGVLLHSLTPAGHFRLSVPSPTQSPSSVRATVSAAPTSSLGRGLVSALCLR